ncbi:MAG: hypothetical protein GC206_05425 [Alphaproteobacteria bacterium]|nr:hypothetical protein [Alphaproteobacteria bacterium]
MSRSDAPNSSKSHLPVVIGSFVTGVAAVTLLGVAAPSIAAAGAGADVVLERSADGGFVSAPNALTEITETQRAAMAERLRAAEDAMAAARAGTDQALARLDRLSGG